MLFFSLPFSSSLFSTPKLPYSAPLCPCVLPPCPFLSFPHLFANSLPHSHHPTLRVILSLILHPHPPFPPLLSQELIASSFVLGEQRGTMAEWGLSLWQQAGDKRGREGGEERQKEKEQAQRGCWLLAGRQESERWLITLVSMHTAIKLWCTHTYTVRAQNIYRQPHTHFLYNIRESASKWEGGKEKERGRLGRGK